MDNPFTLLSELPEKIKSDIDRLVNNVKIQAQIEVLELELSIAKMVEENISARIATLKSEIQ